MKFYHLLITGIFPLLSVSCSQDVEEITNKEISNSIEIKYSDFKQDIQEDFDEQAIKLGLVNTKSNSNGTLLDIFLQMSQKELQSFLYKNKEIGSQLESRQDSIFNQFFSKFSAEDFETLNNSLDAYLNNGGHNVVLIEETCNDIPSRLIDGYVCTCAYVDALASHELLIWLNNSDSINYQSTRTSSSLESGCREKFWNELRLMALSSGADYLVGTLSGIFAPEIDVLTAAADVLGAGAAAYDYYACCRGGISL